MKRTAVGSIILFAVILASALSMPAAKASISNYNWIGTLARNNYDEFYGTSITAYEEGTNANLVVNVNNDYQHGVQINVSAVIAGFDWGTNYTSSECSINKPFVIPFDQSHVFTLNFTVPSALFASNLVVHSYTVYAELVNSTSGNKKIVVSWTQSGTGFAVFSSDQADACNYKKELDAYPATSYYNIPLLTAEARELMLKSNVAKSIASDSYGRGDFSTAKTSYKNSLDFIQQAFSNETEKWSTFENSLANLLQGSSYLLTFQGCAWLLFGIGFLLISIGVIVYLARKRPQPRTIPQPS
jgi:hypothetical protein